MGWWILIAIILICALGGGSARADMPHLLILRPLLIVLMGLLFLRPGAMQFRRIKAPAIFLAALAVLIVMQLIPLPNAAFLDLQGRARFADALSGGGAHALSLSPDGTWNSLLALLPPAATLAALAAMTGVRSQRAVVPLLILALASAVLGIAQLSTGRDSPLYFYSIVHNGFPTGFFANRNHHAAMLSMMIPAVRVWSLDRRSKIAPPARSALAVVLYLLFIAMIFATGSRAGLVTCVLGLLGAYLIQPVRPWSGARRRQVMLLMVMAGLAAAILAWMVVLGRAASFERLSGTLDASNELRIANLPAMLSIVRDYWIFGTGFGSFDPVFRGYESDAVLAPAYFNHAHDDWLEFVMTGGLAAGVLLLAFVVWVLFKAWHAWKASPERADVRTARLGAAIWVIAGAASLVDYPVRTPLMGVICALAAVWLARMGKAGEERHEASRSVAFQSDSL